MKSISFYLLSSALLGLFAYQALHVIEMSQQIRKIKDQMSCSQNTFEDETKKMLNVWSVSAEAPHFRRYNENVLKINATNALSYIEPWHRDAPFFYSLEKANKKQFCAEYYQAIVVNAVLEFIFERHANEFSDCWSFGGYFLKPTTEDSLYFGESLLYSVERNTKFITKINNSKIPFQSTITIKKEDTLKLNMLFLDLDFLTDYAVDSFSWKEILVLDNGQYTRIK